MKLPQSVPFLALLVLASLAGCKAKPAADSGFLEGSDQMSKVARNPFQRSWFDQQIDPARYTELQVRPVNMKYVMEQNIWEKANLRTVGDLNKDFDEMAAYVQHAFIRAARNDPNRRFALVEKAGPKTAILELAIVQLVPTKAGLNAIGLVVPAGYVAAAQIAGSAVTGSEDTGKGVVAIEGRVRDGETGKVIFMFADRRSGKAAVIDVTAFSWWGPTKTTIDDWAAEFVRLAGTPADQKVKGASSFKLLIW